jgi:hypothetical protein
VKSTGDITETDMFAETDMPEATRIYIDVSFNTTVTEKAQNII